MTGWHYIDRIICGPSKPNVVFWSGHSDAESWSRPKDNSSAKLATGPYRGRRPVEMVVSGTDAYGQPMGERVVFFMHWRKHKRMMRKMGQ
jgi:hypothetical protein